MTASAPERLKEKLSELNYYRRAVTLLDWDLYTQTPHAGYDEMADCMSYFATKEFNLATSPELKSILEECSQPEIISSLDEALAFTVRRMLRDIEKESRIPEAFIEKFIKAESASRKAWEQAKQASDFSIFAPHLETIIALVKERCGYTDPGKDVYDVLIDRYEEGMTRETIDKVFSRLKEGLLPLLERILAAKQPSVPVGEGTYDVDAQKKVQKLLLDYIGFSFEKGGVGESMHPFTLGFSCNDVRVTNHYDEHDPIRAMFTAIHEGGHAIFDQNVDPSYMGTEAQECSYMGIHESQSRFFENILGRRRSFWIPVYDKVRALLPDLKDISLDEFVSEINHVRQSLIRTEADEVTYCLHIIIRYEIEQEIFAGRCSVDRLPQLWNEKMQEYLHITPPSDAEGILQDMHWSAGDFGYFPSYLLGSIYDGMFLEAMERELGDTDSLLASGRIGEIQAWLSSRIHRYGALRLPAEVIENVCHAPLSAEPLLKYFTEKYTRVYSLPGI